MKEIFESTEFILLLIFGSFLLGQWIYKKTKFALFHPMIISITVIITFLKLAGIDYTVFDRGSEFVKFMLGPSIVALGYVLYEQMSYLKGNVRSILLSIFAGSVVGIMSVILLARLTGADEVLIHSLEPKSVTMAIALSISDQSGGNLSLTTISVVFCGILGSIIGPPILKLIGIKSSVAKGLAMGASAHSIGAAKAMEIGMVEGALSGLAIGLMGVTTALLIPIIHQIMS